MKLSDLVPKSECHVALAYRKDQVPLCGAKAGSADIAYYPFMSIEAIKSIYYYDKFTDKVFIFYCLECKRKLKSIL